jgi:transcriptional pleiotropic regulator of transition state genes
MQMRATGIVRKVDELGRIVLPKELRRKFGINVGDGLEIFVDGESVILQRYAPACVFCHSADDTIAHAGKYICRACFDQIAKNIMPINSLR